MATPPRSTEQRIADTLAKLATTVDCWVPSASASGEVYLIPLSFVWHDGQLTIATPAASRTVRNLRRAGRARVVVGEPRDMADYGTTAHERGLKVIIAGAGGAAHLPGMVASYTPLPVIGVPVKGRALDGLDSLLSIVQMPNGIPVATVAIGGATNAG